MVFIVFNNDFEYNYYDFDYVYDDCNYRVLSDNHVLSQLCQKPRSLRLLFVFTTHIEAYIDSLIYFYRIYIK